MSTKSLDRLLEIDKRREADGFNKRIRFRRILVGNGRFIAIPYIEEEKLIHGNFEPNNEHGRDEAGHGDGEVGNVIGERDLFGDGDGDNGDNNDDGGAGQGEGEHGIETEAYQLGKELTEKWDLPNLKEKNKRVPTKEYVYDLTDRHRRSGQLLDKKQTLRRIVRTNLILGRLDLKNVDTTKLIVSPHDKIYRVLSRERVWKSQAIVFFLRDYSGSMSGDPTKIVVEQHLMIYSWLLFKYEKLVIPRFIVHDLSAKEVPVKAYFVINTAGGTAISSGLKKINYIVESEGLAKNYNIYVFQGTYGDDGGTEIDTIAEIEKILGYANRMGVTILRYSPERNTTYEEYIEAGGFPDREDVFRAQIMSSSGVTDDANEETVKKLIS